jgi:hypothetical protein
MAVYNHLHVRKNNVKLILGIEDTILHLGLPKPKAIHVPGTVGGMRAALELDMTMVRGMVSKAGRTCVIGPGKEGPHPPYYQVRF